MSKSKTKICPEWGGDKTINEDSQYPHSGGGTYLCTVCNGKGRVSKNFKLKAY